MANTLHTRARPPGVYVEKGTRRGAPFQWVKTHVVGFLGLARRGPVGVPVRITSWEGFLARFGEPIPDAFLATAVRLFFRNEGRECYVNRVAHTGDPVGSRNAVAARAVLKDRKGAPSLTVLAADEGTWGNGVRVSVEEDHLLPDTLLLEEVEKGAASVRVKSSTGFVRGGPVTLEAGGKAAEIATVDRVSVSGSRVYLAEPLQSAHPKGSRMQAVGFVLRAELGDEREIHRALNLTPGNANYAPDRVGSASSLVSLSDEGSPNPPPDGLPAPAGGVRLSGGRDGLENVSPADYLGRDRGPHDRTGLEALRDAEDVSVVCAPDLFHSRFNSAGFKDDESVLSVQEGMISHCAGLRNRFALVDAPPGLDPQEAVRWRRGFDSDRAALYYPWIRVVDDSVPDARELQTVPPTTVVAGMYAGNDLNVGVHKPPANVPIHGALELETDLTRQEQALLNAEHVNSLVAFPGRGIRIWGGRTLSSDPAWRYINVRRLFMMIEESVYRNTQWAVFEPNDRRLWSRLITNLRTALDGLWRKGYLVGKSPEEAFFVKCDEETNSGPDGRLLEGTVVVEIGLAAVRPAEYIIVRVSQKMAEEEEFEK
jgi:phage tail sheath protein FI